jgi:Lhr-like helicase
LISVFHRGVVEDFVISAPTAGGKTEAVFLPIASHLTDANEHRSTDFENFVQWVLLVLR